MQFQSYQKYKPSGIDWLGEIPEGWEVRRVKDIFNLITDKAPSGNNIQLLSIYTEMGVKPRSEMEARGNKSVTTDEYWIVKKGDFIVNKLLAWMGAIALSNYNGVTSPAYDILRKKIKVNEKYYEFLFRTKLAQSEFKRNSRGIMDVRLRLYFDKFGAISVPIQDFKTQTAIADYLDKHTTLIDKKIELLKAKKQSYLELKQTLINDVVTKGLDETVEMKDSGIEWIGQIPKHWEVKRLKDCVKKFVGGGTPDTIIEDYWAENEENGYLWISIADITNSEIIETTKNFITTIGLKNSSTNLIEPYTILFSIYASLGKVAICSKISTTNQAIIAIYENEKIIHKKYMIYFFKFLEQHISSFGNANTQNNISLNILKRIFFALPPKSEQIAIANYLDEKTSKIDQIIKKIDENILALQEFRKTLINDVVTGKVKVI